MKTQTKIIKISQSKNAVKKLEPVADSIKKGFLAAFPTETVYGLGANAFDANAVKKIFKAKGRPLDNPMIVHVSSLKMAKDCAFFNKTALKLVKKFWPGPLTLVLKKKKAIPRAVTAGLKTVALRMPSHKTALKLILLAGVPIAAPSANKSGGPSPTSAVHVFNDLKGKIPFIIDSGSCEIGLESTVLDVSGKKPVLLRPGKVTLEELEKILRTKIEIASEGEKSGKVPKSPGLKYTHYAPKAEVILIEGAVSKTFSFARLLQEESTKKTAVLVCSKKKKFSSVYFVPSKREFAKKLFAILREIDLKHFERVIVCGVSDDGIGLAIMNRLRKAASKTISC